jgi:hypothetical protein
VLVDALHAQQKHGVLRECIEKMVQEYEPGANVRKVLDAVRAIN